MTTPDVNQTAVLPGPMPVGRRVFVPALLLALAVGGALALQTYQYAFERQVLEQRLAGSQAQLQSAQRMRASLDVLAISTQKLAADGNPNARVVVDELKRRGMTIDPSKAMPAPR